MKNKIIIQKNEMCKLKESIEIIRKYEPYSKRYSIMNNIICIKISPRENNIYNIGGDK